MGKIKIAEQNTFQHLSKSNIQKRFDSSSTTSFRSGFNGTTPENVESITLHPA